MAKRIRTRDDTDPAEGERTYGDVEFADPVNNKYPIDSEDHVRAAWSYINKKANAAKYSADEVDRIKGRIRKAAVRHHDQRGLSATSRLSARAARSSSRQTRAGPRPYLRFQDDALVTVLRTLSRLGAQEPRSLSAHAADVLADRRQGYGGAGGEGDVVVPQHSQILRHP
jgi:hypothetical protein